MCMNATVTLNQADEDPRESGVVLVAVSTMMCPLLLLSGPLLYRVFQVHWAGGNDGLMAFKPQA